MVTLPNSVTNYLFQYLIEERSLAYILVNKNGELLNWGGELTAYGITNLCKNHNIKEQVLFLEGLLPLDNIAVFLPFVNIGHKICVDIHLFPSAEGDWILLLDSIWDHQHIAVLQQKANDFSLLKEQ